MHKKILKALYEVWDEIDANHVAESYWVRDGGEVGLRTTQR